MSSNVDELSINYEEDGILLVKELDKKVLTKGAWATILFRYQEWDRQKEQYGPDRYSIRRYRKKAGADYTAQGKFNISSAEQAKKIAHALLEWTGVE